MNRLAAANLTAAAQRIPSVTHHDAADITDLETLRTSLKSEAAERGTRLTMLAFLVKALSRLLDDHPTFNTSLSDDGNTLWQKRYTHLGIAVDTPHGLMIPVIRGADQKDIWAVAAEIADLGARAQTRKIRPDEAGGASMTITSLGSVGGRAFTPIINPPEVAIIGFTPAAMEPVWNGEAFEPRLMLPIDLSYDHRVINGADAARFVSDLAARLATPDVLMA